MPELITTKRLIEPTSLGSFPRALLTFVGVLFAIAAVNRFHPLALFLVGTFGAFVGLVVHFPLEMIFRTARYRTVTEQLAREARTRMAAHIGRKLLAFDTCGSLSKERRGAVSATGIAWDGECLHVLDSGMLASIPWSCIRSWTWQTNTASQVHIYGHGAAATSSRLQAAQTNAEARGAALMQSGFFVTVADTKEPVWQFMTADQRVLQRWEEIMRQVQEGRLPAAAD